MKGLNLIVALKIAQYLFVGLFIYIIYIVTHQAEVGLPEEDRDN